MVSKRAKTDRCSVDETAASTQSSNWVKSFWHLWQVPATRAVPLSPQALQLTYVSPVLPVGLWEDCRDLVDSPVFQIWQPHAHGQEMRLCLIIRLCGNRTAYNLRLPFRDEDDCSFPILAALLRVTGLVAECLYHSLCTVPPYPLPPRALLDIPPPHVSSVKWKCRPIKNRQPEADHCCTYANVDTGKYHTRRGRKKKS